MCVSYNRRNVAWQHGRVSILDYMAGLWPRAWLLGQWEWYYSRAWQKKIIDTWQEEKLIQERRVERTTNTMLRDKTWTMAFFVREACAKTSPYYRHNQGQKLIGTMQEKTTKDADGNSVTSMKPKMPMKHNNTGCFKHQTIRKIERVPCGSASWTLFGNSQCFKIPSRDVDLQLTGDVQRIAFSVLEDCREFMYE